MCKKKTNDTIKNQKLCISHVMTSLYRFWKQIKTHFPQKCLLTFVANRHKLFYEIDARNEHGPSLHMAELHMGDINVR